MGETLKRKKKLQPVSLPRHSHVIYIGCDPGTEIFKSSQVVLMCMYRWNQDGSLVSEGLGPLISVQFHPRHWPSTGP